VIARACAWQTVDWLKEVNVRPKNGRPVWSDVGVHVDEELATIAQEVANIINRVVTSEQPAWTPTFQRVSETMRVFLDKAGFDFLSVFSQGDFLATPREDRWRERFPQGVYVRVLPNTVLDREMVHSIYEDAKEYTDHALVIINQQPKSNARMEIGSLRADERNRFVFLPISESVINEAIATERESRIFSLYVRKHLGRDYDPYDVRDPVSDEVSFFGREGLLDEILDDLSDKQRLGLFGLHKMGKSSVMQKLQRRSKFPVAYVYLRKNDSLASIYKRILDAWEVDFRIKYHTISWTAPQFSTSNPVIEFDSATKELLEKLEQVADNPQLGIFLDEIDAIVPYKEGDNATLNLYVSLMDSLRGVQQETDSLTLLVAGIHPTLGRVNYFWGDHKEPYAPSHIRKVFDAVG